MAKIHSHFEFHRPHLLLHIIRTVPTTTTANIVATEQKTDIVIWHLQCIEQYSIAVDIPAVATKIPMIQSAAHTGRFGSVAVFIDVTTNISDLVEEVCAEADQWA